MSNWEQKNRDISFRDILNITLFCSKFSSKYNNSNTLLFWQCTFSLIYIYSSYLIIHFADWLSVMYIIFSSNGFAAHLTLAAFRMIMFLRQFYRITLYFLFADAALILKFLHSIKYEIDKSFRLIHDTIITVCLMF